MRLLSLAQRYVVVVVVYLDAVLRATLLTKDIYIRAHRGRLTGPTTRSLSRPEMSLPSLYTFISKAYSEDREAQQMLRDIQNYKRQAGRGVLLV